jgi:DNA primase
MTIPELKSQLEIMEVAKRLGIAINSQNKSCCPFHEDKTPSLQFSKSKQIATCFSSNCTAGTMDAIDLVEKHKKLSTHEAVEWLKEEFSLEIQPTKTKPMEMTAEMPQEKRTEILMEVFASFEKCFMSSNPARNYIKQRNLDQERFRIGYNNGQFHHGKTREEKRGLAALALLKAKDEKSFFIFGNGCIVLPLLDENEKIVSFYYRETNETKSTKHYYLKGKHSGLYPKYPSKEASKLILTESIIDAMTLLQQNEITKNYEILANYGTEGKAEQLESIKNLEHLQELILFFDGDDAGRIGAQKIATLLQSQNQNLQIKIVQTPDGEDVNSLMESHHPEILQHLIKTAKTFFLSVETAKETAINFSDEIKKVVPNPNTKTTFNNQNPDNLTYATTTAIYSAKGGILKNSDDSLKVTLEIQNRQTSRKLRDKVELYQYKQVETFGRAAAERLQLRYDTIDKELNEFIDYLESYKNQQKSKEEQRNQVAEHFVSPEQQKKVITFLEAGDLLKRLNKLIGESGIVGEEKNRLLLFIIASSYKMQTTLHALVQGSSGSGKTHSIKAISKLMPPEDVIMLTRITDGSLYNFGEYDLQNKLLVIEDWDGLKEEAEYALRELQSNGELNSATSMKEENGSEYEAGFRKVKGPVTTLSATTHGVIYEDNMTRVFQLSIDESKAQTEQVLDYQNQLYSGQIDEERQAKIKHFIQNMVRMLKPCKVVNPYANQVQLPKEMQSIRRFNPMFKLLTSQITILHQYRRKRDDKGRLITEIQDIKAAIDIMFDSIVLKVDELDGSLRQFYEQLKSFVQGKGMEYEFSQIEIRQHFRISRTACQNHINSLLEMEYLIKSTVGKHNRHYFKIDHWDSFSVVRDKIKTELNDQLQKIQA